MDRRFRDGRPAGRSLTLAFVLVVHQPAMAAVITVDGNCTLADAIAAANQDTAVGDCEAGLGSTPRC